MKIKDLVGDLSYKEITGRRWRHVIYSNKKGEDIFFKNYLVSLDGIIIRINNGFGKSFGHSFAGKKMKIGKNKAGYSVVRLQCDGKKFGVMLQMHRMMWSVWIGKIRKGFEINHKDGNKKNYVDFSELECITPKENQKHAKENKLNFTEKHKKLHSLKMSGENHPIAKFSNKEAKRIHKIYNQGKYSQRELGKIFGVSKSCIAHITQGRTYNSRKAEEYA